MYSQYCWILSISFLGELIRKSKGLISTGIAAFQDLFARPPFLQGLQVFEPELLSLAGMPTCAKTWL